MTVADAIYVEHAEQTVSAFGRLRREILTLHYSGKED